MIVESCGSGDGVQKIEYYRYREGGGYGKGSANGSGSPSGKGVADDPILINMGCVSDVIMGKLSENIIK